MNDKNINFVKNQTEEYWQTLPSTISQYLIDHLGITTSKIHVQELKFLKYKNVVCEVIVSHRGSIYNDPIKFTFRTLQNNKLDIVLKSKLQAIQKHYGLSAKDVYRVDVICPPSKSMLMSLVDNIIDHKYVIPINKPLHKDIYQYKITFMLCHNYNNSGKAYPAQRKDIFVNSFGNLYTLFDNEQLSEYHKFSKNVISAFENTTKKYPPNSLTLYVNDDITLSMLTTAYKHIDTLDFKTYESGLYISRIEKFIKE